MPSDDDIKNKFEMVKLLEQHKSLETKMSALKLKMQAITKR